jgi:hypothetical protein
MNNPKIEHIQKAIEYMGEPVGCNPTLWFIGVYKRINEIALAEQQESEYITAEQARELGEDKVEWFAPYANPPTWIPCRGDAKFPRYFSGTAMEIKYRAIKQAQPEPVDPDDVRIELVVALNSLASDFEIATYSMQKGSEDRAHAEGAIAHAMKIHAKHNQNGRIFKNETKPVDPHADNFAEESHPAYRAMYAKQVAEGTTGFYLWEFKNKYMTKFAGVSECSDWHESHPMLEYRCTDISCYVSKDGEPAIRMLRTEAQELQRQTKDTHNWFDPSQNEPYEGVIFSFNGSEGFYTYKTKATIKLDGNMVTPEQAVAEWDSKKETHDLLFSSSLQEPCPVQGTPVFIKNLLLDAEYDFEPKALKQVSWTGSREDVIAALKQGLHRADEKLAEVMPLAKFGAMVFNAPSFENMIEVYYKSGLLDADANLQPSIEATIEQLLKDEK